MHRLRTTFTRSRTPTGAEMKTQNSLEVPKQVRSASFDEMQLEAQRTTSHLLKQQSSSSADERSSDTGLLQVPQPQSQRSRSFDSAGSDDSGTFLDVPRRMRARRSSNTKTPPPCYHCLYLEEYEKQVSAEQRFFIDHRELKSLSYSTSCSEDEAEEDGNQHQRTPSVTTSEDEGMDDGSPQFGNTLVPPPPTTPCNITFTLSPTNGDFAPHEFPFEHGSPPVSLMSSMCLSATPPQSPSIEFMPHSPSIELLPPPPEPCISVVPDDDECMSVPPVQLRTRRRSISRQEAIFVEPTGNSLENVSQEEAQQQQQTEPQTVTSASASSSGGGAPTLVVRDIYLAVPDLKRDRAASVDSCFSKVSSTGKTEELQPSEDGCFLTVPNINATRSRSVDIVLPTDEQARYKALALTGSSGIYADGKAAVKRTIRIIPDWTENAIQGDHYWKPTSVSGDLCCVDNECRKNGPRMKCSACQLIAHQNCIPIVNEKTQLACKPTFRDVGVRQYREQTTTHHHWVHRRAEKGKCKQCGKAVQGKLFGSKEIVALSCAWCKDVYHNKEACFNAGRIGEECSLGNYSPIIVPPSWIVKLPNKGNFKSSLRNNKRKPSNKKKPKEKEARAFIVKPIPSPEAIPVIVFINPKSGGNQGVKLLGKFQWILNPRQVFDLTQGGPKMGLEMFRKAPQLRVLACGGDGTVGWVLSVLDQINIQPPPAVGVLPLGTGNDLARALGWGGGYTDEPIGKILFEIGMSNTILLDRWRVNVTPNPDAEPTEKGKDNLPLNVINNYFSFGVDAHIALEFHEAREAHPERFNSRLRNKMYYGQMGGKDLILRKYRNLADWVTLEADGVDYTPKLKEARVHAILVLNIPSYGGGTHPWNDSFTKCVPATDDGMFEIVGLTTYQLPMLQAGAHGTCIVQCKSAKIVTTKTIPMQVDGEACRVKPSIIEIDLLNKAVMLAKRKHGRVNVATAGLDPLHLNILRITMPNYEQYHYDKDMLKNTAVNLGNVEIDPVSDLEQVRNTINKFFEESTSYPKMSQEWCFVDSCTAERFFRIDRAQEHLHYITDIATDEVYVLDQECPTLPQTPDQERAFAAFQQRQEENERRNIDQTGRSSNTVRTKIKKAEFKFKSNRQRLFSLTEDCLNFSSVLEKTSDAILLAAQRGDINLLRALHEQGFSLKSEDTTGQTALHIACKLNHKDIVKYMISCAPHNIINKTDSIKGSTALHVAAENKRRDISVMLVAAGANLSLRDDHGCTPMMVAFNNNARDIATYLESKTSR
ncbi:eye-specific diacylglycerol kinase isoform X1 [Eupeodes corollae]|uniref:eye-specific diacylglycerol kinase isoform X1 n=1 Tax=Eupeodes corollae TaxID=290404 RepID=UPI00249231ED|nr:eye-specific diacylglycerol kinase isoform X1 [Eupeodes corollae]XP_055914440.1 eye-specific diacylglycerol kinase isoform X1 [Eupeodes corollae]